MIARIASLRLTLAALALLAVAIAVSYSGRVQSEWMLAAPLGLLAVNLGAAMIANPAFRRQGALLAFHVALLALVLLVAAGRLTYLKGRLELSTGETFSGTLSEVEAGPLHRWRLDRAAFENEGFTIAYSPGVRRDETRNLVSWADASGQAQRAVIGDQEPLVLQGYRFYTSPNKGFAPLFTWTPRGGSSQAGTIHLPAYPIHEYRQALEWSLPGLDAKLWTMLQFDEVLLDPSRASEFRLPSRHTVVMRVGEERREMQPGDRLELPQGVLAYRGLTTWMGYTVFYDWTLPWLLAACALAVASLAWHFWRKFAEQPWDA